MVSCKLLKSTIVNFNTNGVHEYVEHVEGEMHFFAVWSVCKKQSFVVSVWFNELTLIIMFIK